MPEPTHMRIAELEVRITFKAIKHLHLSVHPPEGAVQVSAPLGVGEERIRRFVSGKIAWVRRQQRELRSAIRHEHTYASGETHYVWGRPYRLRIVESAGNHHVSIRGDRLILHVRNGTDKAGLRRCLLAFYRDELAERLPPFRQKWEAATGLTAAEYRIKRMRTKWGSCTLEARRIWLNVELAKHAPECLSYIVLHELLHLQEKGHTAEFRALLTRYLPEWPRIREGLNTGFPGLPKLSVSDR